MNSNQNLFFEVAKQVNNKNILEKLMNQSHNKYDLRPFKIIKLTASTAKKIYSSINKKYSKNQLQIDPIAWHENQRRMFIWFLVCYQYFIKKNLQELKQRDWITLSKVFFQKDPIFLEFQFKNLVKTKNRVVWNHQEDQFLKKAVANQQKGRWNQVSKQIFFSSQRKIFKTPKQCRERWFNHLDESKNKSEWTPAQDLTILRFIEKNGKKWAKIAHQLNDTRTEHMIKNRYNSLINKSCKSKIEEDQQFKKIPNLIIHLENQIPKSQNGNKHLLKKQSNQKSIIYEFDKPISPKVALFDCFSPGLPLISPLPKGILTPGTNFFDIKHQGFFEIANANWPKSQTQEQSIKQSMDMFKLQPTDMSQQINSITSQQTKLKKSSNIIPLQKKKSFEQYNK